MFTWGANHAGQLGVGDQENRVVPTLVTGLLKTKTIVQVAAGASHTFDCRRVGIFVRLWFARPAGCWGQRKQISANAGSRRAQGQKSAASCCGWISHHVRD